MWYHEKVTSLKGIGPKKAIDLAALGIETLGDLLEYYPRAGGYLDYSQLKTINMLSMDGSRQLFQAEVYHILNGRGASGRAYSKVLVRDKTGYGELYFFLGQRYTAQKLKPGDRLLITGKVRPGRSAAVQVSEANVTVIEGEQEAGALGILPTYSLTGSLTQKAMYGWIQQVLAMAKDNLPESLPEGVLHSEQLLDRWTALKNIHFPENWRLLEQAKERFIFEELFVLQCGLLFYREQHKDGRKGLAHSAPDLLVERLLAKLPYKLTEAQQQAWSEIKLDMEQSKPMHRILQGDVGSGKTVISALALAKAAANGYQGCLMAPTEILASQHYATLQEYFADLGVRVALLTGGMRAKARRELLLDLELGLIDIVIGTHALLQENVKFKQLSVVITDEQHRFGVEQRAILANKNANAPDVLVMTATPIPRTLALTVYGDLDISVMKGRPPGRKPVKTLCYANSKRIEVYKGMARQVRAGHQTYVVCPLVEESEQLDAHSAEQVYEELLAGPLKGLPVGLLHGRMKQIEKDRVMESFVKGDIKVLVSTTVIEVGVNVPNSTLMVIENAERFGLAQLHQLRGRVGRGSEQSYCVLLAGNDSPEALDRLGVLHSSEDGFYLAQKDLELRGAGQLFGLRQHGLPDLHIADLVRDSEVIARARRLAQREIVGLTHRELNKLVELQFGDRFAMIFNT